MKKTLLYISLAIGLFTTYSCRKYVEIEPLQVKALKKTKDYQLLLYNRFIMEGNWLLPLYSGDDVETRDNIIWQNGLSSTVSRVNESAYIWAADYFGDQEEDTQWNSLYNQIYSCNIVANGVMDSQEGTETEKKAIRSAALVHRAYSYLALVNLYARQYDPATASSDPGGPLQLTITLTNSLKRATVKQVYDKIIADAKEALPQLPATPDFVTNPSKMAAYALLARAYLNTRDFDQAGAYADSALAIKNTLLDLNLYRLPETKSTLPLKTADPEIMFLKKTTGTPPTIPVSNNLLSLLGTKDLRYQVFTVRSDSANATIATERCYFRFRRSPEGIIQVGPTVPEMMLIKAEVLARSGHTSEVALILNNLRKKRFTPGDYADLTPSTAAEALQLVINERRREFMCTGMRWFDMRRYDKDGLNGTITKYYKGQTYSISANSNRYMYPIAPKYINLNPEIEQNPR